MKRTVLKSAFLCLLFLSGCHQVEVSKSPLVETVAVLMFDNASNDLNAADVMQEMVYQCLSKTGYRVSDLKSVNEFLNKAGIVDGGQLPVIDPMKLGKDLNVQALLYGSVESFNYVNVGFFVQRKVTLALRMVDVATGQTIWENTGSGSSARITIDEKEAQKNFSEGLAVQALEKMLKSPLVAEAKLATVRTLRTLPGFVLHVFPGDASPGNNATDTVDVFKKIMNNKKKGGY